MDDTVEHKEILERLHKLQNRLTNDKNSGLLDFFKNLIGKCSKKESISSLLRQDSKDRLDLDKVQQNKLLMKMIPELKIQEWDGKKIDRRSINFFLGITDDTNKILKIDKNRAWIGSKIRKTEWDRIGEVNINDEEFKNTLYDCIKYQLNNDKNIDEYIDSIKVKIGILMFILQKINTHIEKVYTDMNETLKRVSDFEFENRVNKDFLDDASLSGDMKDYLYKGVVKDESALLDDLYTTGEGHGRGDGKGKGDGKGRGDGQEKQQP